MRQYCYGSYCSGWPVTMGEEYNFCSYRGLTCMWIFMSKALSLWYRIILSIPCATQKSEMNVFIVVSCYNICSTDMREGRCVIFLNTLKPRQNGHHFQDDIFKRMFLYENYCISMKILLKFFPQGANQQYSCTGLDNGLAPARWQAIIWTNAGQSIDAYMRNLG